MSLRGREACPAGGSSKSGHLRGELVQLDVSRGSSETDPTVNTGTASPGLPCFESGRNPGVMILLEFQRVLAIFGEKKYAFESVELGT